MNSFLGALASGILLILLGWLASVVRKKYRASRLFKLFKKELEKRDKAYLSSHLISSVTGYTEDDVEILCCYHKNITRNELQIKSWCLTRS